MYSGASQPLHCLAQDLDCPVEVQLRIGGVGQAVPRLALDSVGEGLIHHPLMQTIHRQCIPG